MNRERNLSVRFAAVGGQKLKAEMRDIGAAGRDALRGITAGSGPASDGLDNVGLAASQARMQLEGIAAKAAASAAALRTTAQATTAMQRQINTSAGVRGPGSMSAAEMLSQGQALDDLRAKFSPLFGVIRQYRNEVSEVRAAHLDGAISSSEMSAAIGRLRTEALGTIDKIKGISAASRAAAQATEEQARAAREAAASTARQAQELSDLRARYNPVFGVIRQYRTEVESVRSAHAAGAVSSEEMAAAIGRLRTQALGAIDKIKGISAANREAARSADEAAASTARQAQELSDLRARYNPIFGVIRQYRAEVDRVRAAHAAGAISANEMASAIARLRTSSLDQISMLKGQTTAVEQMSRSARGATLRMQQMFFQVNDIGVSLAGGMNPFVVMAQQGTQIAQIYGFGNGGASGIFRDLGGLLLKIPGPLKAIGIGAALGAVAIKGLQSEINAVSAVQVTFGDTALAVWQEFRDAIWRLVKPAVDAIAPWFERAWDLVVSGAKMAGNVLVKSIQIAVAGIDTAVGVIPTIFTIAFQNAKAEVFAVLSDITIAVAELVQGTANAFNAAFNTNFTPGGGLAQISAEFATSMAAADAAARSAADARDASYGEFEKRRQKIMSSDPMGDLFGRISGRAQENARNRIAGEDEGGGGGGAGSAAVEQKRAVEDLIASLQQELLVLRETDPVKKKMIEYSEQLAEATDAERAQVLDLVKALDRAENGWEAVGRKMAEYAEESKRLGGEMGDAFVGAFGRANDAFAEFVTKGKVDFSDMINSLAADLARLAFQEYVTGPLSGWLGSIVGGISGDALTSSLRGAGLSATVPSFDGGGSTGFASRSGGLDGKGGFLAMLHPRETVIDHTRGQGRGGAQRVHVTVGIDQKTGNLHAMVDERAAGVSQSMLDAYDRHVIPGRVSRSLRHPREVG